ncbi:MAG: hypothetical protein NTX99_11615, partial [Candidatus Aminicenantes bacterium]|nr:hypothetical protein [Candidatus Aminicenantes bacterium]
MTNKLSGRLVLLAAVVFASAMAAACDPAGRRVPAAGDRPGALIAPLDLRCEYRRDPLGIDAPRPRLSWALTSEGRAVTQSAY